MERLRFRVTNERSWEYAFDAASPSDLSSGVRAAWDDWISEHWGRLGHPAFAYRARMAEIAAWLRERKARHASDEQRRSWAAQAQHWRAEAAVTMGETEHSPLRLHVRGGRLFHWLVLDCKAYAPRVPRRIEPERATALLRAARRTVAHAENIDALICDVDDSIRTHLYGGPRLLEPVD